MGKTAGDSPQNQRFAESDLFVWQNEFNAAEHKEIVGLLKKILAKLEEIRMELP